MTPGASPPLLLRMIEEQHHRDDDDRPLREIRTPAAHLRPGDVEHRACPYAGRRHGLPMNAAALRQISTHWDPVLAALARMRRLYRAARGDVRFDLVDVWRLSQYGAALPWFHLLRRGGALPGFAAALAKANQGVGLWAQRVLVDALVGRAPPAMTAAAIAASAEANGTLVGEVEACAGSDAMLRRFLGAMLDGDGAPDDDRDDDAALAGFAAHYTNVKLVFWLLALARRFVYADVAAALAEGDPRAAPLAALAAEACDPPDFFLVGPADPAATPAAARIAWLTGLASLVVPLAPADGDRALVACAAAVAQVFADVDIPATLAAEVATTVSPAAAPTVAGALTRFLDLDALLAAAATAAEAGLRGDDRGAAFDAAARDRLVSAPARAALAPLAPSALVALAR